MTPNDKLILMAFVRTLAKFDRPQLPADLQSQLNALQNVSGHTLELEKLMKTAPDLETLYRQECDRLMEDASERQKGYLPKFESNEENTELSNLTESICHAPNSVDAAKKFSTQPNSGKIKQIFSKLFN